MRIFGQTGYAYRKIGSDIDNLTTTCWPQFIVASRDIAHKTDTMLAKAGSLLAELSPARATSFIAQIVDTRGKLLNHLEMHKRGFGCGCTNPGDRQLCEGYFQTAQNLVNSINLAIEEEKKQAPSSPEPEPTTTSDPITPTGDPEYDAIKARLKALKDAVAAKKAAEEQRIKEVQERHKKQAAYTRDTQQIRPKTAGYATESEKIMGGSTGYYKIPKPQALSGFGDEIRDVNVATKELLDATKAVKQIAADVKAGVVPKSELETAIANLKRKEAIVKSMSKGLSGYGQAVGGSSARKILAYSAVGAVAGAVAWYWCKHKKTR